MYTNGDTYTGSWVNGKKEGYGEFTKHSGDRYTGDWNDDEIFGKGTKYYADGRMYEGEWLNGKKHGHGKEIGGKDDLVKEGLWVNGRFDAS